MKQIILTLSVVFLAFAGCKEEVEPNKAGFFVVTDIQNTNLGSIVAIDDENPQTVYSLGDLKASKQFYFWILNGGDNPIFNVRLNIDNPHFTIAPDQIGLLPKNQTDNIQIISPITLGVLHGIQLNGVGSTDLLPMGENIAELKITGQTIDAGDTIDLESKFLFSVHAKVMDVELYSNGDEIELNAPTGSARMGNYGVNGHIRYYDVTSNAVEIKNVGNVEIVLHETTLDNNGKRIDVRTDTLLQNQTLGIYLSPGFNVLELESQGTITNSSRINLSDNGKGYIAIIKKEL